MIGDHFCYAAGHLLCGRDVEELVGAVGVAAGAEDAGDHELGLGQGPVLSVVVMMAFAVILSVCSTVDAFVALAYASTFSDGSLAAFLVYGPMIDIKSILLMLTVFSPKAVALVTLLVTEATFWLGEH